MEEEWRRCGQLIQHYYTHTHTQTVFKKVFVATQKKKRKYNRFSIYVRHYEFAKKHLNNLAKYRLPVSYVVLLSKYNLFFLETVGLPLSGRSWACKGVQKGQNYLVKCSWSCLRGQCKVELTRREGGGWKRETRRARDTQAHPELYPQY